MVLLGGLPPIGPVGAPASLVPLVSSFCWPAHWARESLTRGDYPSGPGPALDCSGSRTLILCCLGATPVVLTLNPGSALGVTAGGAGVKRKHLPATSLHGPESRPGQTQKQRSPCCRLRNFSIGSNGQLWRAHHGHHGRAPGAAQEAQEHTSPVTGTLQSQTSQRHANRSNHAPGPQDNWPEFLRWGGGGDGAGPTHAKHNCKPAPWPQGPPGLPVSPASLPGSLRLTSPRKRLGRRLWARGWSSQCRGAQARACAHGVAGAGDLDQL